MFKIPSFLLNQDAALELHLGNNAYEDLFAAAVNIKCRFEPFVKKTIDANGNEVVSSGRMFISPYINITPQSRITFNSTKYDVISVQNQFAINSYSHKEVILK